VTVNKEKFIYKLLVEINLFACSDLSNNEISVIAADAFDGLRSLTSLWVVCWKCLFITDSETSRPVDNTCNRNLTVSLLLWRFNTLLHYCYILFFHGVLSLLQLWLFILVMTVNPLNHGLPEFTTLTHGSPSSNSTVLWETSVSDWPVYWSQGFKGLSFYYYVLSCYVAVTTRHLVEIRPFYVTLDSL